MKQGISQLWARGEELRVTARSNRLGRICKADDCRNLLLRLPVPRKHLRSQIRHAIGKPLRDIVPQPLPNIEFQQRFNRHIPDGGDLCKRLPGIRRNREGYAGCWPGANMQFSWELRLTDTASFQRGLPGVGK